MLVLSETVLWVTLTHLQILKPLSQLAPSQRVLPHLLEENVAWQSNPSVKILRYCMTTYNTNGRGTVRININGYTR